MLPGSAISYGKAAIVGTSGDIEHAAVVLHPRMGKPMRDAIGGAQAIIPSNLKIGGAGSGHKDDWSFDQIDTLSIMVPNAPQPDEIVDRGACGRRVAASARRQVTCRTADAEHLIFWSSHDKETCLPSLAH